MRPPQHFERFIFPTGQVVEVDHDRQKVTTRLRCGEHTVDGTPPLEPTEADEEKAAAMGYEGAGALWRMTIDNELAHTWLALETGRVESAVLWHEAHKELEGFCPATLPRERSAEEGLVLAFQRRWARLGWRPWSRYRTDGS